MTQLELVRRQIESHRAHLVANTIEHRPATETTPLWARIKRVFVR